MSEADAILAAALARRPAVVIPGHAPSPMDCDTTIPVDRALVHACDSRAHRGEPRPAGVDPLDHGAEVLDAEMLRTSLGLAADRGAQRTA